MPIEISLKPHSISPYHIQLNFCTDPFCDNFGLPQERFINAPNKPSRYKISGSKRNDDDNQERRTILCNPHPFDKSFRVTKVETKAISNFSVAEEIVRLQRNETLVSDEPDYEFHKENCEAGACRFNPFIMPNEFLRRGKSRGNSQRWQCKECGKITNVMPDIRENYSYKQKRNDILPRFAEEIISHSPVKRACEKLKIGSSTYYQKLQLLYICCLQFLERYEQKALSQKEFGTIWLTTDQLIYHLNKKRKHGHRAVSGKNRSPLPTHLVASADKKSFYVFRADIAFDWNKTLEDVERDTITYKEDKLAEYARINARLRDLAFKPQEPDSNNWEEMQAYIEKVNEFISRKSYVDGVHINSTYTLIAQLWLIKNRVKTKKWRLVSDDDDAISTAVKRVFADEIKNCTAHQFVSRLLKVSKREKAVKQVELATKELENWAIIEGLFEEDLWNVAKKKLAQEIKKMDFHKIATMSKEDRNRNLTIEHPLPSESEGCRVVRSETNLAGLQPDEIARLIMQVNSHSVNTFFEEIRRRIMVLERPFSSGRGGRDYSYANYNPKYAQYLVTILRTWYNFINPIKSADNLVLTPAQRLGITDKRFTWQDIIYFK